MNGAMLIVGATVALATALGQTPVSAPMPQVAAASSAVRAPGETVPPLPPTPPDPPVPTPPTPTPPSRAAALAAAPVQAPVAIYRVKQKPPLPGGGPSAGQVGRDGAAAPVQSFDAQAVQFTASTGASGQFDVAKPILATADAYSLTGLAVSSADRRQIIEVGWSVDRSLNGDNDPHLYVYHWVDGKPTCYNGCGFALYDGGGGTPGMKLAAGDVRRLIILHASGGWWISANNGTNWMGYFLDTIWGGHFTQAALEQWYGQVFAYTSTPCTDMGNGLFGTASSGARITGIALYDATVTPDIITAQSHPAYYTAFKVGPTELRFGGPGAC